ncbi:MAG: hypothetical protein QOC77_2734 [Thermoleophilaceae bacterium]|jgi:uncharacterized membrane protein|nr:hypothetical protein [Thermoleophilaceae bacterium]
MGLDPALGPEELYAQFEERGRERRAGRRPTHRHGPERPHGRTPVILASRAGRVLALAAAALAAATVIGLVALWPNAGTPATHGASQALGGPTQGAQVVSAALVRCPGPTPQQCRQLTIRPDHGHAAKLTLGPASATPAVEPGAAIRVRQNPAGTPGERYSFVDRDRRGSLLWLGLALALAAVVVLWWRGALALVGIGLSILVIAKFIVPSILEGSAALPVAVVGSLAVMWITLILTNGLGAQTLAAALGIGSTLLLTAGLAELSVKFAHLNGYTGDLSLALSQQQHGLNLQGVVLAGMVIGALGVLADTAVTQASAVMALRKANPALSARRLFSGAFGVGRDHLSATIHTLVLAYAGGALPLLLVLRSSGVGLDDSLNTQDVAEPIVAGVIGCLGLVTAVPLTTLLASVLIARVPAELVPAEHHGHAH